MLKILFCRHCFSPLNIFLIKGKDPDPDPQHCLQHGSLTLRMGRRTGRRSVVNTLASTSRAAAEHLRRFQSACRLGYSEFNNLMAFTSKKLPNNILILHVMFYLATFSRFSQQFRNQQKILCFFNTVLIFKFCQ